MAMKKEYKYGIIGAVVLAAIGAVLYVMGVFSKSYSFDWIGGNKVAAKNDGKFYSGLHVPSGDVSGIAVGDYVNVTSDNKRYNGKFKVLMLGSDDGSYNEQSLIVIDIEDPSGADGTGSGTFKKA